jgi:hypothetical protein
MKDLASAKDSGKNHEWAAKLVLHECTQLTFFLVN